MAEEFDKSKAKSAGAVYLSLGLDTSNLKEDMAKVKQEIDGALGGSTFDAFNKALSESVSTLEKLKSVVDEMDTKIKETFNSDGLGDSVKEKVDGIGEKVEESGTKVDTFKDKLSNLKKKIYDAFDEKKPEGFGKEVEKSNNKANKLSSTMKNLAKTVAVAFSVKKVIDFSKSCIEAANLQTKVETKLMTVMKQRMNATDDSINSVKQLASELQQIGVIGDEVALAGASQFATFTNSAEAVKTILPAMENLAASMYGTDVNESAITGIANQLGKAFAEGNLTSLKESGITVSEAELAKFKTLTNEEEKAAYMAQIITNNVGEMNEALAHTHAGSVKQLSNNFGDLKEQLGRLLQEVIIPIANVLNTVVLRLQSAVQNFAKMIGVDLSQNAVQSVNEYASGMTDSFASANEEAEKLNRNLLGIDEITKLGSNTDSSISSLTPDTTATAQIDFKANVSPLQEKVQNVIDKIKKKFSELWGNLSESKGFQRLKAVLGDIVGDVPDDLNWLWKNVLEPFLDWVSADFAPVVCELLANILSIIDALKEPLKRIYEDVIAPVAGAIGEALVSILQIVANILGKVADWMQKNPDKITALVETIIALTAAFVSMNTTIKACGIIDGLIGKFGKFAPVVSKIGGIIGGLAGKIGAFIAAINPLWLLVGALVVGIGGIFYLLRDQIKEAFDTLVDLFKNPGKYWDALRDVLSYVGEGIWNWLCGIGEKFVNWFTEKKDAFINWVTGIKDGFIEGFTNAIDKITEKLNIFKTFVSETVEKIKNFFSGIGDKIENMKTNISNKASGLWEGFKSKASSVLGLSYGGKRANGGSFKKNTPVLVTVGDNKSYDEHILNEKQLQNLLNAAVASGGGNEAVVALLSQILSAILGINLTANISGDSLANVLIRIINSRTRSTGRSPIYT